MLHIRRETSSTENRYCLEKEEGDPFICSLPSRPCLQTDIIDKKLKTEERNLHLNLSPAPVLLIFVWLELVISLVKAYSIFVFQIFMLQWKNIVLYSIIVSA